jgi:fructokinase
MYYGAIEAGGTKFVCAVGLENGEILEKIRIETTMPKETLGAVIDFFRKYSLKAIGIGSFGPIDINRNSKTYGFITSTPKKGWTNYPIVKTIQEAFSVPIFFNTDVNVAALGELEKGAAKGLDSCLYITVGTGIGAGAVVQGQLLEGFSHPEMGHILVRRHANDTYEGKCPFHKDCLEGLASGPAVEERWGKKAVDLADRMQVWEMEAYYIAQALMQYMLILAPKKIILGGGIMKQRQLFPLVRQKVKDLLNGYLAFPEILDNLEAYIVPPALGDDAGIIGALYGAIRVAEK